MHHSPGETEVVARLTQWAEQEARIRAVIWTSSRTNPQAPVDLLSDYDIILVGAAIEPFATDEGWMGAFGRPMVRFRDMGEEWGTPTLARLVLYADGTKIDYSVWPVALLQQVRTAPRLPDALDVGYRVLVDKDSLTQGLPPPTYTAHIPLPPTAQEYQALVEEFWWESIYVAKNLWRDELVFAKYNLDTVMKFELLRKLLEWRIELDYNWAIKPGAWGRELKKRLDSATWADLAGTYVGADLEENWDALLRTTALFRRVAITVGEALGHTYLYDLDAEVTQILQDIRALKPPGPMIEKAKEAGL
jgi:aminoglycoside 6-adenylyltransferase